MKPIYWEATHLVLSFDAIWQEDLFAWGSTGPVRTLGETKITFDEGDSVVVSQRVLEPGRFLEPNTLSWWVQERLREDE